MKLVSLNIWGGRVYEPLMEYIKEQSANTDIFCLQEVFFSPSGIMDSHGTHANILADLKTILPSFHALVAPVACGFDNTGPTEADITEAQATFIKKSSVARVDSDGSVFVYGNFRKVNDNETFADVPHNFHYARFSVGGKKFVVMNVHGVSEPADKLDTPKRLVQSQKIVDFLRGEPGTKIVCGDFNLLPETKSVAMIEEAGMVNLIKKFKTERTRSRLSPFWGRPDFQKFADYAFVSPDVNVMDFTVPDVSVSDHLPLVLEFE